MRVGPDRLGRCQRRAFVGGVGVGVDKHNRQRLRPLRQQCSCGCLHSGRVDGLVDTSVGQRPLRNLQPHVAIDHGHEIAPQAPGLAAVAPAHFQHVPEPCGRDHTDPGALSLQQRVGADRCAVDDGTEAADRAECTQALQKPRCLVPALRRYFCGFKPARCGVDHKQVGERSADIDANSAGHAT